MVKKSKFGFVSGFFLGSIFFGYSLGGNGVYSCYDAANQIYGRWQAA